MLSAPRALLTLYAVTGESIWAIDSLERLIAMAHAMAAIDPAALEVAARTSRPAMRAKGPVAVLPLMGPISQRGMGLFDLLFGGTSAEAFAAQFKASLNDDSVRSILLHVDSPGGTVGGIDELSTLIYKGRGIKPIVAVADGDADSAAYWIASAADEFVAAPSAKVGSIGIFSLHENIAAALEQMGTEVTVISAGKYKSEEMPFGPLTDEARAAVQARVDGYYGMFVAAVARNRGVTSSAVRGGFGEGRVLLASDAVAEGMVDRIATFDEVLGRLTGNTSASTNNRAMADAERDRLGRLWDIALDRTAVPA